MGGISTSTGIFSGIDTASLIEQLLQAESRPKFQFQSRVIQLQSTQAAYLDLNSRLSALETAAAKFRTSKSFDQKSANSSNDDRIAATATTTAAPGSYRFIVDRLVTTRQQLSKGFADKDVSAFGAGSFTFESAKARLDADAALAELNGGTGIKRGKFTITQDGTVATIDLSKAANASDVLNAINSSGLDLTATATDGGFEITSGGSAFAISETAGGTTAASLGLTGVNGTTTTAGSRVLSLNTGVALSSLNDGSGVYIDNTDAGNAAFDFRITLDEGGTPTIVNINLGDILGDEIDPDTGDPVLDDEGQPKQVVTSKAVTSVGGVIDRVNTALADAGVTDVTLGLAPDGVSLQWANSSGLTLTVVEKDTQTTTARDLGILTTADASATITGERVYGAMNSKLLRNLNGGSGVTLGVVNITARDGSVFNADLTGAETVQEAISLINAETGGAVTATLNDAGTGLSLTDTTGGLGLLTVSGATADELGISNTGVAADTIRGGDLELRYVSEATSLDSFNAGKGIGSGTFTVRDSTGTTSTVTINEGLNSIGDVLRQINREFDNNAAGDRIQARINDSGDGIVIEEISAADGAVTLQVIDESGTVAKNLGIAGEASGTGDDNFIDGSLETTVTFSATDTLEEAVQKINDADPSVGATIINDGTGVNPFRISFASDKTGKEGRYVLDTEGFDLGLSTLDEGDDARVFFGSSDPAKGVLVASSTNTLSSLVPGVTLDLKQAGEDPVDVNVTTDDETLLEDIEAYVSAFNDVVSRIDSQTAYNAETEQRGALLGDGTVINLRARLFSIVQGTPLNVGGQYNNLAAIGITIGADSQLEIDSDRLNEALEEDRDSVEALLSTRELEAQPTQQEVEGVAGATVRIVPDGDSFAAQGIASLLEELAKSYTNSVDGVLTGRRDTIDAQIKQQEDRIEAFDARLEARRAILEQQFIAMERSIAGLQQQQASLGQIAGLG